MARPPRLDSAAISERLAALPEWSFADGALHRDYRFRDFSEAFGFMTRGALAAERMDHHPEWTNVYSRVSVSLSTHDAGGVTELDFRLAAQLENAAAAAGAPGGDPRGAGPGNGR